MDYSFVYMTAKDKGEARRIGEILVAERLVACVNIIDGMESIYQWEGKVVKDQETVMIAKTKKNKVMELVTRVKSLHSYTIPCIIEIPILSGNPDYLQWIARETEI